MRRLLPALFLLFIGTGCTPIALAAGGLGLLPASLLFLAVAPETSVVEPMEPQAETAAEAIMAVPQSRTDDGAFVLGYPDAPLTIVEFSDFLCPHCQAYQETARQVIDTYVETGMARYEYRMMPVIGPQSEALARLAECVHRGAEADFWQAKALIFDLAQEAPPADVGPEMAARLGLDYAGLLECTDRLGDSAQYITDRQLATSIGISGTPSMRVRYGDGELELIDDRAVGGIPFETIATLIEEAQ